MKNPSYTKKGPGRFRPKFTKQQNKKFREAKFNEKLKNMVKEPKNE
jgi:hypothetical protein